MGQTVLQNLKHCKLQPVVSTEWNLLRGALFALKVEVICCLFDCLYRFDLTSCQNTGRMRKQATQSTHGSASHRDMSRVEYKPFKNETLVPQHHVLMGTYLTSALLLWHQRLGQNSLQTSPFSSYVSVKFCLVLRFLKRNNKTKTLSHSQFSLMLLLTRLQF